MLRRLAAIIRKDLLVRFSSPSELLFFLVLPVVFIMLLSGAAFGDGGDVGTVLPVVMQEEGGLAARLLVELEAAPSVEPRVVSLVEAETMVSDEQAPALLVVPADFSERLAGGEDVTLTWRALPDNTAALAVEQTVRATLDEIARASMVAQTAVAAAEDVRPFSGEAERRAYYEESLEQATALMDGAPSRLEVRQALPDGEEEFSPAAQASAGQLITWVFIPLLGTSGLFAYERRQGTMRRLLTTPASKATFLLGAISSQMVAALVQMLLLVAFGIFVLNLDWDRAPGALLLLLVAFGLAAVALGTMLGVFTKNEGQASGASVMAGMVMALLGGCWYPLELFPAQIQTAAHVLPTTWAMRGLLDLVVRGSGMAEVLLEVGVLLGFAALFFAVGVSRFRYE